MKHSMAQRQMNGATYKYELNQLQLMGAWEVVDLPEGETTIPYQIVFKDRLDSKGKIETYQF